MHYAALLVLFTPASLLKCRHPLFFGVISGRKQPWGWELARGLGGWWGGTAEQAAQEANKPEKYASSISIYFHSAANLTLHYYCLLCN